MEQSDEDEEEEKAAFNCQINKRSIELTKVSQKIWYFEETPNTEYAAFLQLIKK